MGQNQVCTECGASGENIWGPSGPYAQIKREGENAGSNTDVIHYACRKCDHKWVVDA